MVNTNNHPPLLLASQRSATHKQHLTEGVPSAGTCVSFLCCFVGKADKACTCIGGLPLLMKHLT